MSAAYTVRQIQVRQVVADLVALGDALKAEESRLWINAARGAALLESLRLGLSEIEPFSFDAKRSGHV
ncbi:MAG: hypothetical protein H3C26_20230 [Rhodocyclaceae bacterium]|nr:hypothetical protein [Rhodocyclaceae bacterium]